MSAAAESKFHEQALAQGCKFVKWWVNDACAYVWRNFSASHLSTSYTASASAQLRKTCRFQMRAVTAVVKFTELCSGCIAREVFCRIMSSNCASRALASAFQGVAAVAWITCLVHLAGFFVNRCVGALRVVPSTAETVFLRVA